MRSSIRDWGIFEIGLANLPARKDINFCSDTNKSQQDLKRLEDGTVRVATTV